MKLRAYSGRNDAGILCTGLEREDEERMAYLNAVIATEDSKGRVAPCMAPGCTLRLKPGGKLCFQHSTEAAKEKSRIRRTMACKAPGCTRGINHKNQTGYCADHRPKTRLCRVLGCDITINSKSPGGTCKAHRTPVRLKEWRAQLAAARQLAQENQDE